MHLEGSRCACLCRCAHVPVCPCVLQSATGPQSSSGCVSPSESARKRARRILGLDAGGHPCAQVHAAPVNPPLPPPPPAPVCPPTPPHHTPSIVLILNHPSRSLRRVVMDPSGALLLHRCWGGAAPVLHALQEINVSQLRSRKNCLTERSSAEPKSHHIVSFRMCLVMSQCRK
jgi:hypothetical protein